MNRPLYDEAAIATELAQVRKIESVGLAPVRRFRFVWRRVDDERQLLRLGLRPVVARRATRRFPCGAPLGVAVSLPFLGFLAWRLFW